MRLRTLLLGMGLSLIVSGPLHAAASPQSKACSDQATAKGLHGAERETFRDSCLKASAPAAAAKPAAPVAAAPASAAKSAFAPKSDAAKACSDQATAKGLHGAEREKFRDACLKGSAPAAARPAAPAIAAAPSPARAAAPVRPAIAEAVPPEPTPGKTPAPSAAGKPRSANQLASDRRIKACGAQWQAAKAANKLPAGAKWPAYWSDCSKRLKAAGQ